MSHTPKARGWSREFPTDAPDAATYLLIGIPRRLWTQVRAMARGEGVSVRTWILRLLTARVGDARHGRAQRRVTSRRKG